MAATFKRIFRQDLTKPLQIYYNLELVFSKDNLANEIQIELYNGSDVYSGGGSVSGTAIRADGRTVPLENGTISGNVVTVALTEACMEIPGTLQVYVKLTSGDVKTTIFAGVFTAIRTETGTVIDPGTIIPSITELINQIDAAIDSIPADYSTLLGSVAGTYSASKTYAVGDYAWYNGSLYRCTTAISTAEAWTSGHWTEAVLGDDVSVLKSAINFNRVGNSFNGVLYDGYWNSSGVRVEYTNYDVCNESKISCPENATVTIIADTTITDLVLYVSYLDDTTRIKRDTAQGTSYNGKSPTGTKYICFTFEKRGIASNTFGTVGVYINALSAVVDENSNKILSIEKENSANIQTIISSFNSDGFTKSPAFEPGRYVSGTGTEDYNYTWMRVTEPILVNSKYILNITASQTLSEECILVELDSRMNFIGSYSIYLTSDRTYSLNQASYYIKFCIHRTDMTGITITFSQSYNDSIPSYFQSQLDSKVPSIIGNMNTAGKTGCTFVFVTDPHWDSNYRKSPELVNYILEHANISNVFCGGDVINEGEKQIMYEALIACVKAFQFPLAHMFFPIARGNHDDNSNWIDQEDIASHEFDYNTVYNLLMNQVKNSVTMLTDTEFSFWFDQTGSKTRYIFIDTRRNGQYIPHSAIIALLKTVPSGWHVVFIMHMLMRTETTLYQGADVIAHIVKAYNDRTSGSYIGVNYDFTSDAVGYVDLIIGGHLHRDRAMDADDTNNPSGVPIICTDTDSWRDHSGTEGTVNSQCFDVVTVDYTNKTVKCVRIGRGDDRTFSY